VSNGLFIRSYPAAGVQVVPMTYGAGNFGYVLLVLFPVLIIWWAARANVTNSPWLLWSLVTYAVGAAFAMVCLRHLKLEIRTDGISYGSIFRETIFVAFSDISTVVLLTNPHSRSTTLLPRFLLSDTMVITPKPDTHKPTLKIRLALFPIAARTQLTHLLRPEEWDIQA